jgi:hypothetical protein
VKALSVVCAVLAVLLGSAALACLLLSIWTVDIDMSFRWFCTAFVAVMVSGGAAWAAVEARLMAAILTAGGEQ